MTELVFGKKFYQSLIRIQAVSGAVFSIFLILHLTNTLLAVFGVEAYNGYQQAAQRFYQQPVIELGFVLFPLMAHSIAGVFRYLLDKRAGRRHGIKTRLQTITGFFLLLVVWLHILATRGVSVWFDAEPGFLGVAFTFWWMPAYFYPYYFLLFMAGFYHVFNGLETIVRRVGLPSSGLHFKRGVFALAAIGAITALLAFAGTIYDIPDPRESAYAKVYSELMSIELYPETQQSLSGAGL